MKRVEVCSWDLLDAVEILFLGELELERWLLMMVDSTAHLLRLRLLQLLLFIVRYEVIPSYLPWLVCEVIILALVEHEH